MWYASHPDSQRFLKEERLCSKKLINDLFKNGNVKKFRDFRFHFLNVPGEITEYHQVLFSIPKKLIPKAVHRNTIRRKLRESYRRNKSALYITCPQGVSYLLAYVYISSYDSAMKEIEKQVTASFDYLIKKENLKL